MLIISDIHLGAQRQAGTTPVSQAALKQFIRDEFRRLVNGSDGYSEASCGGTLVINGDLLDSFSVDPGEVISAYETLTSFIINGGSIVLGMGNHDESAKGSKTSSFHLLAHMLESRFPQGVQVVDHNDGLTQIESGVWMIPHMLNQDLFDIEIDKACQRTVKGETLLLHCNIMSPFAEHSDHSLNLVESQVDALAAAGWQVVVGHEHPGKSYKGGKVILPGNQIPSSISDCLGNKDMAKYYATLNDGKVELVKWLDLDQVYAEVNWRDLALCTDLDQYKFIRVTGDCTAAEAAEMVNVVSKARQVFPAFVIANSVKVEGIAQMEGLAEMSMESLNKFDVLGALLEELDEREQLAVKELLK